MLISDSVALGHAELKLQDHQGTDTGPACRMVCLFTPPAYAGNKLYCLVTVSNVCEREAKVALDSVAAGTKSAISKHNPNALTSMPLSHKMCEDVMGGLPFHFGMCKLVTETDVKAYGMVDVGIASVAPGRYVGKTEHHWVACLHAMLFHVAVHVAWTLCLNAPHISLVS